MASEILAVAGALLLAILLGVSDAPNATASLVAGRAGPYRGILAWSVLWHFVGALVAGLAVARTIVGLVRLPPSLLVASLGVGCIASAVFTLMAARRGLPVSASVGLVGGLAGAGVAARGFGSISWFHVSGFHVTGILGVLGGIFLAPFAGGLLAALISLGVYYPDWHFRRSAIKPVRLGTWAMAAWVGIADGTNDGQKAMGIMVVAVAGTSGLHGVAVAWWIKVVCGLALAVATAIGGRRIIRTVSRGLYRGGPIEGVTTQATAAAVIFGTALMGIPVSTSAVVTSGMVGAGMVRRRHHVRWRGVEIVLWAWVITVPACALGGFLLFWGWRLAGGVR